MQRSNNLAEALAFLHSWLSYHAEVDGLPGFSVAVMQQGTVIFSAAYGHADTESGELLTPQHVFNIGSQAKMVTATVVMQQVQAGKIALDAPAATYLPWLHAHRDHRFGKLTVRQLLSHQSGLIRDGDAADYWQLLYPFPDAAELRKLVLGSQLAMNRAVRFKYSNLGYALLGQIIEAVTGQSYAACVRQQIAEPLSLSPLEADDGLSSILDRFAAGYLRVINHRRPTVPGYVPAHTFTAVAGVYANPENMCRFLSAHIEGSVPGLDHKALEELHYNHRNQWIPAAQRGTQYGLGFATRYMGNRMVVGHGGSFMGHTTATYADPQDQLVVAVMSNAKDAPAKLMVEGIFSVFDFFQSSTKNSFTPVPHYFNIRLMNAWTTVRIVAATGRIVTIFPDSWLPFDEVLDELKYDPPTSSLTITNTHDMDAEHELVQFNLSPQGEVLTVRRAGTLLWPETVYKAGFQYGNY